MSEKSTRYDKCKKIPFNVAKGINISITDKNNYLSFKEVMKYVSNENNIGIGFVFSDEDDILGIDIDDIENLSEAQRQEIQKFIITTNSYTELTSSLSGYHIIIKGKLPENSYNRRSNFEVYEKERFFAFTGTVIKKISDNPEQTISTDVNYRQEQLNYFIDNFLGYKDNTFKIEENNIDKNDLIYRYDKKKYESVISGNHSLYYSSQSSADFFVAKVLLSENNFNVEVAKEKMLNLEFLVRDKYYRKDYLERTILNALNSFNQQNIGKETLKMSKHFSENNKKEFNYIDKEVKIIKDIQVIEKDNIEHYITTGLSIDPETKQKEYINIVVDETDSISKLFKNNYLKNKKIELKGYFTKKENGVMLNDKFLYNFKVKQVKGLDKYISFDGNLVKNAKVNEFTRNNKTSYVLSVPIAYNKEISKDEISTTYYNLSYFFNDKSDIDIDAFKKGAFLHIEGEINPSDNKEYNDKIIVNTFKFIEKVLNVEYQEKDIEIHEEELDFF